MFGLGNRLGLYVPLETEYLYALLALLLPVVFLLRGASGSYRPGPIPLADYLLSLTAFVIPAVFALKSDMVLYHGWEYSAPLRLSPSGCGAAPRGLACSPHWGA